MVVCGLFMAANDRVVWQRSNLASLDPSGLAIRSSRLDHKRDRMFFISTTVDTAESI